MMNVNRVKKIAFTLFLLFMGFAGGFFSSNTSFDEKEGDSSSQTMGRRRAMTIQKQVTSKTHPLDEPRVYHSFSVKNLNSLIKRLAKNPDSKQLENEFRLLLQYPYKRGDKNIELAMHHLFSYWGKENPRKALEAVMELSGAWLIEKRRLVQTALSWNIEHNPTEVAGWFEDRNTHLYLHKDILPTLSTSLTKKSPEEAWEWLSSLRYAEQNYALVNFFEELALSHPEKMKGYIQQLESPENWGTSISRDWQERSKIPSIVRLYAKCDYEAAEKWVESFPEGWQGYAISQLASVRAEFDLAGATEILKTHPGVLSEIADTVIASGDNDKISSWLHMLAEVSPDVSPGAYLFIGNINAIDSLQMIKDLPAGKVKDTLNYCYIVNNIHLNTDDLSRLLGEIQNPEVKKWATEIVEEKRAKNISPQ